MASAKTFLTDLEKDSVAAAIRAAEQHTSGEIRVHIEDTCDGDSYTKAVKIFQQLNMDKTPFRNAVLLYISVKDHKIAIVGDEAIHHKVHNEYWKKIIAQLHDDFAGNRFCTGITHAVNSIGKTLANYFPNLEQLDRNELPNDISFS
jgi:uncharacterized membrane protein